MKIEEIIRTTTILNNSKRIILNVLYAQNIINEKFNEVLRPYDLQGSNLTCCDIRGQKGNPANMSVIQERMIKREQHH
jgi:hypothetical protein